MKLWLIGAHLALLAPSPCVGIGEVIYAINCGGEAHTDLNGIRYDADVAGTASDFGRSGTIRRVSEADQILYQTRDTSFQIWRYRQLLDRGHKLVCQFK